MTETTKTLLEVYWEDLLNAFQATSVGDVETVPLLDLNSGELTCRALLDDCLTDHLMSSGQLLELPTKSARKGLELRTQFANSLCDVVWAGKLHDALVADDPFSSFDLILSKVPVEAHRWLEEERRHDLTMLCRWFERHDIEPVPQPQLVKTIIEFPLKRLVSLEENK